jgi:hypothetical protein
LVAIRDDAVPVIFDESGELFVGNRSRVGIALAALAV